MPTEALTTFDWNFDKVSNDELVACCYWEYARESAFIRDVRQRCSNPKWLEMTNSEGWKYVDNDIERIQSIGYAAEVFLRGFFFDERHSTSERHPNAPPITGSFPNPWQSLSEKEQKHRAHIRNDIEVCQLQPFVRDGSITAAEMLLTQAKESVKKHREAADKAHAENPGYGESTLRRWGKYPSYKPSVSVLWESGSENTIIEIQWACFTNDEIVECFRKWVRTNRPKQNAAPDGKGKKLNDWRVALNRLGIMRALHAYTFADNRFPAAFKERGEKFCYAARKSTLEKFWELFPFHPKGEKPISWQTKGRRCK